MRARVLVNSYSFHSYDMREMALLCLFLLDFPSTSSTFCSIICLKGCPLFCSSYFFLSFSNVKSLKLDLNVSILPHQIEDVHQFLYDGLFINNFFAQGPTGQSNLRNYSIKLHKPVVSSTICLDRVKQNTMINDPRNQSL